MDEDFYKTKKKVSTNLNVPLIITIAAIAIILTVLAYGTFIIWVIWPIGNLSQTTIGQIGTLGDSFGILNCLFTGLGFAGLLTTIFLQREDLRLTRIELTETRSEIKRQSQTFIQQQFDDSFYKMLALYKQNLENLTSKMKAGDELWGGVDALYQVCKNFDKAWKAYSKIRFPKDPLDQDEYTLQLYEACQKIFLPKTRYVETFNSLILLIQNDCFSEQKKEYYCNILASQLTVFEVKYLFYQAFLNKENSALRNVIVNSTSFQKRLYYSGIPTPQWRSFEHLWKVTLPKPSMDNESVISTAAFESARERIKKREAIKKLAIRNVTAHAKPTSIE